MNEQFLMAYTPPTNGRLVIDGKLVNLNQDFRTVERYREYKECGFDVLMQAGETKYKGEPFDTSDLKKMMDMAYEVQLKFLVFDQRIIDLMDPKSKVFNAAGMNTKDALVAYIKKCMCDYTKHPAFLGVIIGDEPDLSMAGLLKKICSAIKSEYPNCYLHDCFLPLSSPCGVIDEHGSDKWKWYRRYIKNMVNTGIGQFDYDDYPFGIWEGKEAFSEKYIRNLQVTATEMKKYDSDFCFTIQSFSSGKNYELRMVDEDDLRYQANIAMGFGVKRITYFTYWRFQTRASEYNRSAIIDDDGTRILYDEAKRTNIYIKKMLPLLSEYEYGCTMLVHKKQRPKCFRDVRNTHIELFKSVSAQTPVLINELRNGTKRVYMIFNATDSYNKETNIINIEFNELPDNAKLCRNASFSNIPVNESNSEFKLKPGEAVFIFANFEN